MPPRTSIKRQAQASSADTFACQKKQCSRTSRWRHKKGDGKKKPRKHPHGRRAGRVQHADAASSDDESADNSDSSNDDVESPSPGKEHLQDQSFDESNSSPSIENPFDGFSPADANGCHAPRADEQARDHDSSSQSNSPLSDTGDDSPSSWWSSEIESDSEPDLISGDSESDSGLDSDPCSDSGDERDHAREFKLHLDTPSEEVVLFSSSQVTVRDLSRVLESLQASSKLSDPDMAKIVAVIKAILPPGHAVKDHKQL